MSEDTIMTRLTTIIAVVALCVACGESPTPGSGDGYSSSPDEVYYQLGAGHLDGNDRLQHVAWQNVGGFERIAVVADQDVAMRVELHSSDHELMQTKKIGNTASGWQPTGNQHTIDAGGAQYADVALYADTPTSWTLSGVEVVE